MATIAEFERDVIAQRTKDALQRGGRPASDSVDRGRFRTGWSSAFAASEKPEAPCEIASSLTADCVQRARGGQSWSISTVHGVLGYSEL
jgi:hypothetical protein